LADALDRRRLRRIRRRSLRRDRSGAFGGLAGFGLSRARGALATACGTACRAGATTRRAAGAARAARTRAAAIAAVVLGARGRVDVRRLAIGEPVTAIDPALDAD